MTVKIIKGMINYRGIPFLANTSQNIIEDMDDAEAERLITMGIVERTDVPIVPPLQIFTESSEKIKAKIAELEGKLIEAKDEKETLLGDDLQDIASITKKIDMVNGRVDSLQVLIIRQRMKLEQAEKAEALEAEKTAVRELAKTTKGQCKEAEKILNEISDASSTLMRQMAALSDLYAAVDEGFIAAGGGYVKSPLLSVLTLPEKWSVKHFEGIQEAIKDRLANLGKATEMTSERLRQILNSRHFKTQQELEAEAQEYDLKKREEEARKPTMHEAKGDLRG